MSPNQLFGIDLPCELVNNIDYQQHCKTLHFHLFDYQTKDILINK